MRNLIISGDSFTYGSELKGKSWAELLGSELGFNCINRSIPGCGNNSIAKSILEMLPSENCAVAVMWTFISRFDFYQLNSNSWITTGAHDNSNFGKSFMQHVGNSEYYELHNSLTNVLLLQNTLEKYKIPYVFTLAESDWRNFYFAKNSWIATLISMIDWNIWYFIDNGAGFSKWGTQNYQCGPRAHPLHQANIDLVKDMKPFVKSLWGL